MDQPPASFSQTKTPSMGHRDRRREKQQLSCNFCRSRKIRCDRQLPCKTCVSKDIATSCTYSAGPQRKSAVGVYDRIQELEALVRSLMNQQQHQTSSKYDAVMTYSTPSEKNDLQPQLITHSHAINYTNSDGAATPNSPAASEHGSLRLHGSTYVSSVHWAAILDSISVLRDVYETEQEVTMLTSNDYFPNSSGSTPGPLLLYQPPGHITMDEMISSIPDRAVVDRMVARYFNTQGVAPAVLSSTHFLSEYESFWQDPSSASCGWIGLLFSIMCLSTQYQKFTQDPPDPETLMLIQIYRERTVRCLVLGQFTQGGPHVLETLIIHCTSEVYMYKDAEIGLWLLFGMVVQLALSFGYHRDPQNFSHISPFAGEMRRRVWAAIVQMDLRLSSQMGLPRLLKSQQSDTAEPRNLLDTDFNETSTELPTSRPESEITPVLYGLAKIRIDSIGSLITDLVADTREHNLSEIMHLDEKLHEAEASLPPIFRWQPLSQSLMVPPQIVLHRLVLQLAIQRLQISLHRRHLSTSYATDERYEYSRDTCVRSAMKIIEFQQLIHEETQPDGLLYPVRWLLNSLVQSIYLLGMSVLCYYIQLLDSSTKTSFDRSEIIDLLRNAYPLWLRLSVGSQDAQRALEHLKHVLELRTQELNTHLEDTTEANLSQASDQLQAWDAYHGIASFSHLFDSDLIAWGQPSTGNMFSGDWDSNEH